MTLKRIKSCHSSQRRSQRFTPEPCSYFTASFDTHGNRTEFSLSRSVSIVVINRIGRSLSRSTICKSDRDYN